LGRGDACGQRPQSPTRPLHAPPLGPGPGPLSSSPFLSTPNARSLRSLAATRRSGRSWDWAVILADSCSASPLAPASLRNFSLLPTILAWEGRWPSPTLISRGQRAPWARASKNSNSACPCSITYGSTIGPPGLWVTAPSSSDSVPFTRKPDPRSTSTPVKISSTATAAARAAI